MPEIKSICKICGKPAIHTCGICGYPMCEQHYSKKSGMCASCTRGRMIR